VSAGNSGAFMAKAMLVLRLLPGVERPAIATMLPSLKGHTVVLDMGANVDCSPLNLVQFAVMGEVFAHDVLNIHEPRVGLLSNGEESSKGTELTRETHARLEKLSMNYIGYVEGRDIFLGGADVVVTDGFTGNVLLKSAEGIAKVIGTMLKEELRSSWLRRLGYLLASGAFRSMKRRTDYREVGGALLLGINGIGVICHGSSNAVAIMNAIRVAKDFAERRVNLHVMEMLQASKDSNHWASKKERGAW
jgi:glycerol-3-phosphate acyltransferase PlsX